MSLSDLPAVNACLNGASTVLLTLGYIFIKQGRQNAHRNCMVGAVITSTVFLACYLTYHYFAGRTTFRDPQWFRPIYLVILLTHTILAMAIVPLVLITVFQALRKRWESHKRIARWTWPIWMYVSVTGVVIYLLLYQIFPQSPSNTAPPPGPTITAASSLQAG
jgi:putative membrane protein